MEILLLVAMGLWLCWLPVQQSKSSSTVTWPRFRRGPSASTHQRQHELELDAQSLRELAALLRSGLLFDQAVQALLEVRGESSPVAVALQQLKAHKRLSHNQPLKVDGHASSSVRRLHWCLQLSARSGAPLADVFDQLAQDVEADLSAHQSFEAAMAGPRATTKLLTWLPIVGLGAGFLMGIDVVDTLLSSTAAQASFVGGIFLWSANRIWCRKLLNTITAQALK